MHTKIDAHDIRGSLLCRLMSQHISFSHQTHAEQNFNHLWEVRVSSLGHTKIYSSPFLSLQGQLFHMVTPLHIYKGLSYVMLSTQIQTEAYQEKVEMFSLLNDYARPRMIAECKTAYSLSNRELSTAWRRSLFWVSATGLPSISFSSSQPLEI